jgi:hypothetical protein
VSGNGKSREKRNGHVREDKKRQISEMRCTDAKGDRRRRNETKQRQTKWSKRRQQKTREDERR